jgi:hypothetical protein
MCVDPREHRSVVRIGTLGSALEVLGQLVEALRQLRTMERGDDGRGAQENPGSR